MIPMPIRGERAAPIFDKTRPRELIRYFNDLEFLFPRAYISSEAEKKEYAVYYVDFETEQAWKSIPEYANTAKTYQDLKEAILFFYPDASGDYLYSLRDVDDLIVERRRIGIATPSDLSEFHLQFLGITAWLIEKNHLGKIEQNRAYPRAFHPMLLAAINHRLRTKFPDQHPSIPLMC